MFNNILLVGLGGGIGSMLRYLCQRSLNARMPVGTFLVNIAGCLIIGLLWGYFSRHADDPKRMLLVSGFCGGFTTFSSFTQEGIQMLMENRVMTFAFYIALSVLTGLLATWAGYKITN
jgi:CrcB protein